MKLLKKASEITLFERVKPIEVLLFTKHLALMIKAGITITEALETLADQKKSPALKKVLSKAVTAVANGSSLAAALKKHPKVFTPLYTSLIEISEKSGTLEKNLEFLAVQLNKSHQLQQKIRGALLYPALVTAAAIIMSGFITFFVLPQLVDFFEALDVDLPITTKILLFIAHGAKDYGVAILLGAAALTFTVAQIIRTKVFKPHWHNFLLHLPLVGRIISYSQLAQFARNFGVLLQSGVPITTSLTVTEATLHNEVFKSQLQAVSKALATGKSIGSVLSSDTQTIFPPMAARIITVGEKTGKLDETLLYLADFFEDEIDSLSKNLSTVLEPILLLSIGLVVGFVALAIITPIYELTSSVR